MACDSAGNTWVGTLGGLAVFNPDGLVLSIKGREETNTPEDHHVSVSPNPTKSSVVIEIESEVGSAGTLLIRDILGRVVFMRLVEHNTVGTLPLQWDCRDMRGSLVPKGLYHIAYYTANAVVSTKLIME